MTRFHAAFENALEGRFDDLWPHLSPDDRTLGAVAVYRNTATKGRIDALELNFPTIAQMVGSEWFRAAAREFVEEQPGDDPFLAAFGAGFPDWLTRFTPAQEMPFLGPVARLDRAWTEAHLAREANVLDLPLAASLGYALFGKAARLHPSVNLFWFDWTAPSLWISHRYPAMASVLEWRPEPEGLLIHRSDAEVRARRLDRVEWTYLDACRQGLPFGAAALAAKGAAPSRDLTATLAELINLGVFEIPEMARPTA